MDRDKVTDRRQAKSLTDDCIWVLVTQQYEGNIRHLGLHLPNFHLVHIVIGAFSD
jgi:hypothetical protein